jgi:phosphate transport system substrate-binding protein
MNWINRKLGMAALGIAAFGFAGAQAAEQIINGAGASFPEPVYRIWTYNYQKVAGVRVNYQSVGSGAGINQIKSKTVDFGASDNPLKLEELDKNGLIQFPMLMGGVVVAANLPGVANNQLKLDGETLAAIFMGDIKSWNDDAIEALNPGVTMPRIPITVVHRSDSSGTTWIFTDYLAKVSAKWKKNVGADKSVSWPVGIGGQKNPGVSANIQKVKGAIGYVEYTYALEAKLPTIALKNREGEFVNPEISSFQAAAANADWQNAPGMYMELTNQPGKGSWPITGVTYIIIYKDQSNLKKAEAMLKYFNWCFVEGGNAATKLQYVPVPENVVKMIKTSWSSSVKSAGNNVKFE